MHPRTSHRQHRAVSRHNVLSTAGRGSPSRAIRAPRTSTPPVCSRAHPATAEHVLSCPHDPECGGVLLLVVRPGTQEVCAFAAGWRRHPRLPVLLEALRRGLPRLPRSGTRLHLQFTDADLADPAALPGGFRIHVRILPGRLVDIRAPGQRSGLYASRRHIWCQLLRSLLMRRLRHRGQQDQAQRHLLCGAEGASQIDVQCSPRRVQDPNDTRRRNCRPGNAVPRAPVERSAPRPLRLPRQPVGLGRSSRSAAARTESASNETQGYPRVSLTGRTRGRPCRSAWNRAEGPPVNRAVAHSGGEPLVGGPFERRWTSSTIRATDGWTQVRTAAERRLIDRPGAGLPPVMACLFRSWW